MTRRCGWISFVAVLLLMGCGRDGAEVSPAAQQELRRRVAEVRASATAQQPEDVEAELAELRVAVDVLQRQGEVSDEAARRIVAAADTVSRRLGLITTNDPPAPPGQDNRRAEAEARQSERNDGVDDEDEDEEEQDDEDARDDEEDD